MNLLKFGNLGSSQAIKLSLNPIQINGIINALIRVNTAKTFSR